MEIADGIIELDSDFGKEIVFTSDRFEGQMGPMPGSYLWKTGNEIYISAIISKHKGQGYLSELFKKIEAAGYQIAVPTPLTTMEAILKKKGFVPKIDEVGTEVWRKLEIV